jgi:CzcA family heavy metal efflux pump
MTQANGLPTKNVSKPPVMLQPRSSTSRVMMIGLSSKELSLVDLSVLTRWTIKPRLMGVPGVANVSVWGQRQRQLQVQVDPERLRANGVTMEQVVRTAGNSLWISPLSYLNASTPGVTGGFIDTPTQRLGIRHVLPISNASDLSQVIVADASMHLGEVATVVEDHQPLIGDAVINDGPGLLLTVEKLPSGNTLEVTRGVEKALDSLRPGLTGVEINSNLFRPASFIEQAIDNLAMTLLIGCLLMVLVLGAFLFQWRTALISVLAIPVSLVAAALVLQLRGATINTMILAGFVVALGSVVDDAIIDVENIMRRLREARRDGSHKSIGAIILEASLEVRGAIIFATLIIVLAVAPVLFMDGLSGAFFQPLAISYALALMVSMLVALTLTPALSMILLARAPLDTREPPLMRWLGQGYQRVLKSTLHRPRPAFVAMGALALVSLAVVPFLGQSLLPKFKENNFLLHWVTSPGTSLPEMTRITSQASRDLRATPGVRTFAGQIGRAVQGDEIVSINSGQNWVSIDPKAGYDATSASLQRAVESYPGLSRDVLTYLQERIRQVLTGTASAEPIIVRVFGTDMDVLRQKADEVRTSVAAVDGVADAHLLLQVEEPTVEVKVDLNAIQPYGLKPGDVRRAMATLISGTEVGNLFEQEKVFDVVVSGTADARHSLSSIQDLLIEAPNGGHVRVGDIASVRVVPSPNIIKREGASRYIDIGVGVAGRDLGAVARDVQTRVHSLQFPREFHAEMLGEYTEREAAQNRMIIVALAALIGIFLLLQASFGSWKLATVAFLALPTALLGGVLAAFLGGGSISLGSLVGFLTVLGIAARNGIMLILHYQHLEQREGQPFGFDLVLRGARERLAPIVMTAAATGLALVPLVVAGGAPGHEIEHPMAVVILGGLVTSTLLNLFLVPALYLRFGARAKQPVTAVEHANGHIDAGHMRLAPVVAD